MDEREILLSVYCKARQLTNHYQPGFSDFYGMATYVVPTMDGHTATNFIDCISIRIREDKGILVVINPNVCSVLSFYTLL